MERDILSVLDDAVAAFDLEGDSMASALAGDAHVEIKRLRTRLAAAEQDTRRISLQLDRLIRESQRICEELERPGGVIFDSAARRFRAAIDAAMEAEAKS